MALSWQESTVLEQEVETTHYALYVGDSDDISVEALVGECVDKAVDLLYRNINDDSLYLMFEWEDAQSRLSIVVCDQDKAGDSAHRVYCNMPSMIAKIQDVAHSTGWKYQGESLAEVVKYCIADHLSTCKGFMQYSLVAVFHSSSRNESSLL
jgi:hypothetical protein